MRHKYPPNALLLPIVFIHDTLLAPSFLYTQWIPPSRARCSLGRIAPTHDVPLAPSFPPPYLSYPASGHVWYMTASDGFSVRCCALLGSSSWRAGGRGSLMDVTARRRVRAGITQPCPRTRDARPSSVEEPGGGRAPRHLPNAPTRGPRVGDDGKWTRTHIIIIYFPPRIRARLLSSSRSTVRLPRRPKGRRYPCPHPRYAPRRTRGPHALQTKGEERMETRCHPCVWIPRPHPCPALLPIVAEDMSVPSHILLPPPFALRNSRTKHTGGRGEGKWRAHWAVLRFRE
ncbi:hypothetical protein B0H19DRAFT_333557 [Mycena capillaripes]|nr:hypothetical protein B0H19DRAFT_333557 [Mycena capillaripes]